MHPMLNIAIRAARKAGNHIAKSLENVDKIESTQKGTNDFVTNIDKEAESIVIDTIKSLLSRSHNYREEAGLLTVKTTTFNGSSTLWMEQQTSLKASHIFLFQSQYV